MSGSTSMGDEPNALATPTPGAIQRLEGARASERRQTRFYRALAAEAVESGDLSGEDRLNDLHADEQHHLARLTARLLELGLTPAPLPEPPLMGSTLPWPEWEDAARRLIEQRNLGGEAALAVQHCFGRCALGPNILIERWRGGRLDPRARAALAENRDHPDLGFEGNVRPEDVELIISAYLVTGRAKPA